jgi:O-antigen/teichoic acid export membrane protein
MSRSRRFVGGLGLTYTYQGLIVLVGFWLAPFLLRRIGQHEYGLWLVATQLITYLMLMDFGVVALLPLETAYVTGRAGGFQNANELPELVGRSLRIALYQTPVVAIVSMILWLMMPAHWDGLQGPLAIVMVSFVLMFPLRIYPSLLQGLQDLVFVGRVQILSWASVTAATVVLVFAGWRLYALAIGWVVGQSVLAAACFFRLRSRFPGILPTNLSGLPWSAIRAQLPQNLWVSMAQVAQVLTNGTDVLIIATMLGPSAAVPYACTGKLLNLLSNQAQAVMQVAMPGLCELKSTSSSERVLQVVAALTQAVLVFSGLVFCVVLLVNEWFIGWWLTPAQYGGFSLTSALLVNMMARHWNTTANYTVFCFGRQRRLSLTNIGDGLVTLSMSIILVMQFGALGAALGSLAGVCLVSLPCNLNAVAQDTGVTIRKVVRPVCGWIWRFCMVGALTIILNRCCLSNNVKDVIIFSAGITGVYLCVMFPFVSRSSLAYYLQPYISLLRTRYVS